MLGIALVALFYYVHQTMRQEIEETTMESIPQALPEPRSGLIIASDPVVRKPEMVEWTYDEAA